MICGTFSRLLCPDLIPSLLASQIDYDHEDGMEAGEGDCSMSLSPLAQKAPSKQIFRFPRKSSVAPQPVIEKRKFVPDLPMLASDTEDAELTETEGGDDDTNSVAPSDIASENGEEDDEEEDDDDEYSEDGSDGVGEGSDEEEEMWEPPSAKTPRPKKQPVAFPQPKASTSAAQVPSESRVSNLAEEIDELNLQEQDSDDSITILPKKNTKSQASVENGAGYKIGEYDLPMVKKKKRQVLVTSFNISLLTSVNQNHWQKPYCYRRRHRQGCMGRRETGCKTSRSR